MLTVSSVAPSTGEITRSCAVDPFDGGDCDSIIVGTLEVITPAGSTIVVAHHVVQVVLTSLMHWGACGDDDCAVADTGIIETVAIEPPECSEASIATVIEPIESVEDRTCEVACDDARTSMSFVFIGSAGEAEMSSAGRVVESTDCVFTKASDTSAFVAAMISLTDSCIAHNGEDTDLRGEGETGSRGAGGADRSGAVDTGRG